MVCSCRFVVLLLLLCLATSLHCDQVKQSSSNYNKKKNVEPTFHHKYGQSDIFVYDDLINPQVGSVSAYYLKQKGFSYMYPDPYENYYEPSEGNLYWRCPVSPAVIIKSRLWISVRKLVNNLPDRITGGKRFLPYDVYGTMLNRGDIPVTFRGEPEKEKASGKIFIRIFLSSNIDKNVYHDHTFYDENDEIITSIHPKPFRMIAWTGNVQTLFHPPSMNAVQQEYSIVLKLSSDMDFFKEGVKKHQILEDRAKQHRGQPFPYKGMLQKYDVNALNISEHVLGTYYDKHGHVIAFFDNIFPKEFVDAVRSYNVRYEGGLTSSEFSQASSETHDNVEFIYSLEIEDVLDTPYLEVVKKLAEYLSNHTGWYPYDVSCNLIRHTHHTRIHIDCLSEEHEYTFLMYLNPNWTEDMYAETSFYDDVQLEGYDPEYVMQQGMEEYNFITAAIPKFGRIALFRNLIPHSARPPAPSFLAARYTFPIKLSDSYRQARAKMLRESLDYKTEGMEEEPLYDELRAGDYRACLKDDRREWVEKHHKRMKEAKEKRERSWKEKIDHILFPPKRQQ